MNNMRINKLLSNYGYCSRKKANEWIRQGLLEVNGSPATEGQWVEETDDILFRGEPVQKKNFLFYLYHKPKGILSSLDETLPDNLLSALPLTDYVFPVGRLDKESEGLLLLTNDGDLAQRILHSESLIEKEYQVTVDRPVPQEVLLALSKGVDIGIGMTRPCVVERLSETSFRIVLTQGMNRQIRRMAGAFGYQVLTLKRVRILHLHLENLPPGALRPPTNEELAELQNLTT